MNQFFTTFAFLFFLFGSVGWALEGFADTNLAPAFNKAWDATVGILSFKKTPEGIGHESISSGVIVYKKTIGTKTYLGLLTAIHVIDLQDIDRKYLISKNIELTTRELNLDQVIEFKIVNGIRSVNDDLAFFILQVSNQDERYFQALQLDPTCELEPGDPLALVGFPKTSTRPESNQNKKITSIEIQKKRISTGVYVGNENESNVLPGITYGTTVDAIKGNSGGPFINRKGNIVGILSQAAGAGQRYDGIETFWELRAHSYMVSCKKAKAFTERNWQKFLMSINQGM